MIHSLPSWFGPFSIYYTLFYNSRDYVSGNRWWSSMFTCLINLPGAARVRELPPSQFCRQGFVIGKASEAGFGNEMYKILTAAALSVMLNRSLIIGQTRHIDSPSCCDLWYLSLLLESWKNKNCIEYYSFRFLLCCSFSGLFILFACVLNVVFLNWMIVFVVHVIGESLPKFLYFDRQIYPFGDYISYTSHAFTLKEVKHLWRKNECDRKYGRNLIMRIDNFEDPNRTNVLCSDWRAWKQPIIW